MGQVERSAVATSRTRPRRSISLCGSAPFGRTCDAAVQNRVVTPTAGHMRADASDHERQCENLDGSIGGKPDAREQSELRERGHAANLNKPDAGLPDFESHQQPAGREHRNQRGFEPRSIDAIHVATVERTHSDEVKRSKAGSKPSSAGDLPFIGFEPTLGALSPGRSQRGAELESSEKVRVMKCQKRWSRGRVASAIPYFAARVATSSRCPARAVA